MRIQSPRGALPNGMLLVIALLVLVAAGGEASAQNPQQFADEFQRQGERFFSELFGASPEEQRRLQAVKLTLAEEQKFGRQVLDSYMKELDQKGTRVHKHGRDVDYLRALMSEIIPRMRERRRYRDIDVYVIETDATDARAIPGATVLVTTGMLDYAPSEATIVGVLAHELSHIDRAHLVEGLKRMKLAQSAFSGQGSPVDMMAAGKLMAGHFARPFRPEQESEADSDATLWTYQAGYDPMEVAELFLRWHQREAGKNPAMMPSFLRSHPYHIDRYEAVRKQAAALTKKNRSPLYVGRENLTLRVPRAEKRFEDPRRP